MSDKFYLIAYQWQRRGDGWNWNYGNAVHQGDLADWVLAAYGYQSEGETHRLICAIEITEEQYNKLDGVVG